MGGAVTCVPFDAVSCQKVDAAAPTGRNLRRRLVQPFREVGGGHCRRHGGVAISRIVSRADARSALEEEEVVDCWPLLASLAAVLTF